MALVALLKLDIPNAALIIRRCLRKSTAISDAPKTSLFLVPTSTNTSVPWRRAMRSISPYPGPVIPFQDPATLFNRKFRGTVLAGLAKRLFRILAAVPRQAGLPRGENFFDAHRTGHIFARVANVLSSHSPYVYENDSEETSHEDPASSDRA